ncbi:MAG: aspartyl-tRNA synthetase, aspartyl-tRNA synthetase [Candidatus Peregrinibacteria bacterium GW2011_GWF2_38_29]|nr:MAG: aspartyl-tRNA synthetase, aspartyl-tRNA synthetase [Candidatus Peregrinibacteria bacterium GW2011_GWF2_38_29]HBB02885.1 aspartate--tRNA ligase [Candidatus Peregrinibacteria bacterium]
MHKTTFRTHTCDELNTKNSDEKVTLSGWIMRRRDHGGLIFVDLRDRYGLTQIAIDPTKIAEANDIKIESVMQVKGVVRSRPEGMINAKLKTGEIEVVAEEIKILSTSKTPPFEIDSDKEVNEEMRLEYRYLDLRRTRMQRNIIVRHKVIKAVRDYFDKNDFVEVETPMLIKGTPEGSREYLVPSRLYPGKFFVLPQSPQQLKQLLMVSGFDRYFQIARCFRDEDQRGDRQPEFTQVDVEMSFVEAEDVMSVNEKLLIELLKEFAPDKKLMNVKLPRMTWKEAMDKYGADKPDIRFSLEIHDITDLVSGSGFKVFSEAKSVGNFVRGLLIPGGATFSRRELDEFEASAKSYGAHGLIYMVYEKGGIKSPILKYLKPEEVDAITKEFGAKEGDTVLICSAGFKVVCETLGHIRLVCGDKLNLRDKNVFAPLWVIEFPMFEWKPEENKLDASHHPFTAPMNEDVDLLDKEPEKARAKAYDLVLNGVEIGGGSVRIHDPKVQSRIFEILKITPEDAKLRFGHLLRAFEYGPPPHGGIAWGIDRFIMMILDEPNIREVIAFPKDQKAKDLMMGAPSEVPEKQIKEANISINLKS